MNEAPPSVSGSARGTEPGDARPVLLCLSHLRWDFVFQRPQHLMTRAARTHEVIYVEEPQFQDGASIRLDRQTRPGGVTIAVPILPHGMAHDDVVAAQRTLLDELVAARAGRPLIVWFYTPMALAFADHIAADVTLYDCMDELSAFRGAPPAMLAMEQQLLDKADLVFTGGRSLFEAKRDRHPDVHCFPSSIDSRHFAQARGTLPEPAAMAAIPHPRIGFFGVIDERMDLDLVAKLAALRPQLSWVMIGPVVKIEASSLPQAANLHWLGGRGYADLPAHMGHWDAGFMPFALNESTRFISPTKTPEFLAAGLPVVSTPVIDVVRDYGEGGFVEIAETPEDFAAAVDLVLARPREAWLARVDALLAENSWDLTWNRMALLIGEVVPKATRTREHLAAGADHV